MNILKLIIGALTQVDILKHGTKKEKKKIARNRFKKRNVNVARRNSNSQRYSKRDKRPKG